MFTPSAPVTGPPPPISTPVEVPKVSDPEPTSQPKTSSLGTSMKLTSKPFAAMKVNSRSFVPKSKQAPVNSSETSTTPNAETQNSATAIPEEVSKAQEAPVKVEPTPVVDEPVVHEAPKVEVYNNFKVFLFQIYKFLIQTSKTFKLQQI